jgi:GLPGLI family protein
MKNLFNFLVGLTVALTTITTVTAQKGTKSFEGIITYSVNIDSDELDPMTKAMLGNIEQVVYLKGDKSRTETDMGISKSTTIVDNKTNTVASLTEVMGQKYLIRLKPEDIKKQDDKEKSVIVKHLDETKKIQGYTCKKAEITIPESDTPVTVYYTTEIPLPKYGSPVSGIDGLPLEYDANLGGLRLKFVTTSIKTEKVADSKFSIPEGYKETTIEDLQKMFGGGQ